MMHPDAAPGIWIESANALYNKACITALSVKSYTLTDKQQALELAELA
jgi:hypothetical protein